MVLHGLYDTLLKKDMEIAELSVAVASFAWLAWLVRRERSVPHPILRRSCQPGKADVHVSYRETESHPSE